jgi:isoleucyl-tRNA synthetase
MAKYKAIGADVIRWLYCRHSPAQNINFGPEPTDEIRAKFLIKLWNVFALFCNYAAADGFDGTAAEVPVRERPAVDRWILSDLQELIATARGSFEQYHVMNFALEAERFIDDKLSNWYVRVNRPRFWSKNAELDAAGLQDKLSAYQTLYRVLLDLCKLLAPCVPFVAETMWRKLNLAGPASVHLADYPEPDDSLRDAGLAAEMDAVLRIVSLGGAARNIAKQKVRQPLAELVVQSGNDSDRRAVEQYADLIRDELNIKSVRLHAAEKPLLSAAAKLNMKTAGAKIGANRAAVQAALQAADAVALKAQLRGGPVEIGGVVLDSGDISVEFTAEPGWAGVEEKGTMVSLDGRVTELLKREGLARDTIRLVQEARKAAGLELADKIVLHLGCTGELAAAVAEHRTAIASAVQATAWSDVAEGSVSQNTVDGQPLTVALRKT